MGEASRICPECGSPIPPDAPEGVCPRCLLREGLASGVATGADPGRFVPPEPGEIAARFPQLEVLELVGRGGMGAVYRARQRKLDRLVALKILTPEAARGPGFAERFTREARTLARLNHPHIVSIHDFGEVEGTYYFLMEFVDGANLREVLAAGKLSPAEALRIVPQLCDALQFAHEEGIVHRDIKPENILLDRKGNVKIADFGLAKLVERAADHRTLTVPGQMMGTPAYMAPEQIERPTEVDHRADIFSLGVVFYEMLTGELPLGRFQPPSRKVEIDVRLDEVVLRTLEKEPERRYQQASEVRTDVSAISADPATTGARVARSAPPVAGAAPSATPAAPGPPSPPPGEAAGVPRPGARSVEVRRPKGFTWTAVWSFAMAALYFAPGAAVAMWPLGGLVAGLPSGRDAWTLVPGMLVLLIVTMIRWALAAWHVAVGIGVLRVRSWARSQAVVLAGLGCLLFPAGTVISVFALVYLLRRDVGRVFELGEGPAELSEAEAREVERVVGARGAPAPR
jgi:predicted Ser/Thr protein kinase